MKKNTPEKNKNKKTTIILDIIVFLACIAFGSYFLIHSYKYQEPTKSFYEEKSNVDYKVYLNENKFYETDYLDKDMLYVANIIKNIKINFDYNYKIDTPQNIEFTYNIIGKLVISDNIEKKVYLEKNFTLLKDKSITMIGKQSQDISENLTIDYSYYNSLANDFKASYGVNTDSNLIIYMTISQKNTDKNKININNMSVMNVNIPLSKKSIEIALDYKEINRSDYIINEVPKATIDKTNIIITIIFIIFAIISFIKLERQIIKKTNKYNKYVKKILREYDRLIVESSNKISFDGKEIVNLGKFTELLDVHDNLQLPILYNSIYQNKKCEFYIIHENMIYLYTVKSSDFESKNEKKK